MPCGRQAVDLEMLELWIAFGVVVLLMLIGLFGNLIPGVPGTSLIFGGALVHHLPAADRRRAAAGAAVAPLAAAWASRVKAAASRSGAGQGPQ